MQIVIVGAGGHAQVIADAMLARQDPEMELIGFVDDNVDQADRFFLNRPVLSSIGDLQTVNNNSTSCHLI